MLEVVFATLYAVTVDLHQLLSCFVKGLNNQNIMFVETG